MQNNYLQHHGILGQKWGVRRTPEELGHVSKKDARWIDKKSDKIMNRAKKKSAKELKRYENELLKDPNSFTKSGKIKASTINAYNKKMAELMNQSVSDLRSPSGKVIRFVAKRGEMGVMMALADEGYNIEKLKNGVWSNGRVAYQKTTLDKV